MYINYVPSVYHVWTMLQHVKVGHIANCTLSNGQPYAPTMFRIN